MNKQPFLIPQTYYVRRLLLKFSFFFLFPCAMPPRFMRTLSRQGNVHPIRFKMVTLRRVYYDPHDSRTYRGENTYNRPVNNLQRMR